MLRTESLSGRHLGRRRSSEARNEPPVFLVGSEVIDSEPRRSTPGDWYVAWCCDGSCSHPPVSKMESTLYRVRSWSLARPTLDGLRSSRRQGVIMVGRMLSHGAVVAREYGLPAVVNIEVQHAGWQMDNL